MLTKNDIIPVNFDYKKHYLDYDFQDLLEIKTINEDISKKVIHDPIFRVKRDNNVPLAPELDDLCRLHYIALSRKATTIMEFGVGKSTIILADSLRINKEKYFEYTSKALRRKNLYEIHSIDNYEKWIEGMQKNNAS